MKKAVTVLITVAMLATIAAHTSENETKFRASDGKHLIVGASHNPVRGGAAYIYSLDGASWGKEVKLTVHDLTKGDFFGSDVDLDGQHAVVGARWHDPVDRKLQNNKYGAAYFFRGSSNSWVQESFVQASDRELNHEFGGAVAISGKTAVIAAKFSTVNAEPGQGKAYVFQYEDGAWTETQILTAPDGAKEDYFGDSVDIDGDYIFVGAMNHARKSDGQSVGAVWVFERNSKDQWHFVTKLSPPDLEDGNSFGSSIHIAGDVAIVGAQLAHGRDTGSGTAYVFRIREHGWKQETRLVAKGGKLGDDFGHRVWIGGNHIVVGAWLSGIHDDLQKGAAYVFENKEGGWIETDKLSASDGGYEDQFGSAVAVGAGQIIVGASGEAGVGDAYRSGAVYVYSGFIDP